MTLSKEKTLGKLSPDQLAQFMVLFSTFAEIDQMLPSLLENPRLLKLINHRSVIFQWSWMYELSFAEMLVIGLKTMNETAFVSKAAKSIDPQQAVLDYVKDYEPDFSAGKPKSSQSLKALAFLNAIRYTMRSMTLYSISINRLIELGNSGDDESFVKAVSIDPTVLSSPSMAKKVSLAKMAGDNKFLQRLHKAAINGPSKKLQVHEKFRFATLAVHEGGGFKNGNHEHVFEVFANELALCEGRRGDPYKSFIRNVDLWTKASST
ncbi:MAG: hypothetical protein ACREO1_08515 [Arenimonas sp.]